MLAFDLGVLHRDNREIEVQESLLLSAMYIGLGLAFGAWVWWQLGAESGMNYLTGFVVEKTLALDNVFVIALIFSFFAVPRQYQHRVLFWGILGVIVLRAIMIGLGATLVVAVLLGALHLRRLPHPHRHQDAVDRRQGAGDRQQPAGALHAPPLQRHRRASRPELLRARRPTRATGRMAWFVTPLFMALVMIEIADLIFAVDSVPAIFAITTDPFIVYTSNIFAILGLRALYFALAAMIHRFKYLKPALAVVLVFIGSKIFVADLLGLEKFPPTLSLGITIGIIAAGIAYSLWRTRGPDVSPDGKPQLQSTL